MKKNVSHFPKTVSAFVRLLSFWILSILLLSGCRSGNVSAVEETAAVSSINTGAAADMEMADSSMADSGMGGSASETGGTLSDSGISVPPDTSQRKLIRNVDLQLETDTFDETVDQLEKEISALSGYIEHSDMTGKSIRSSAGNSGRHGTITARIPAEQLDSFLSAVDGSGNITWKSEQVTDVTLQYSDLESRKKTLTVEQERLWTLLEQADTVETVIALEERLSEIRYELESMESQLRLYDNQVDYSTVCISILEVTVFTPTEPESIGTRIRSGFSASIGAVQVFFAELFIFLVSASPIWIPLVLFILLLIFLTRKQLRKKKEKRQPDSPAVPPPKA